jgi:predicted HicB family RNase H-like nuclease
MVDQVGVVESVKKVEGFAGEKYSSRKTIEDEEKELEELKQEQNIEEKKAQKEIEDSIEPDSPEEKTFKKRYGDLRRHSQKQKQEFQEKVASLEAQLSEATKAQIELPKSEEEIEIWSKEYPDVAAIIETIAIKKAKEQSEDLQTRMEEINQLQYSAKKEKAEAELYTLHPDFEDIRSTDDFHQWAEEQPKWVQEALYENETDAHSAARAIDLYKVDRDIEKPKKKAKRNSAAQEVSTKSRKNSPVSDNSSSKWRESTVEKMSADEYEQNSDSIMEAIRSGNFIYDISGEAR